AAPFPSAAVNHRVPVSDYSPAPGASCESPMGGRTKQFSSLSPPAHCFAWLYTSQPVKQ
ncbi:unnamed protein product, partial [Staurois parvus]